MGFWSALGTLGGVALAPFTGGASLIPTMATLGGIGGALGGIADVAGGAEGGRAQGLINQAQLQQAQDKLAQERALLKLRAPGMEAANATRGDILANSQDATISGLPSYVHVPTIGGGLRPSMLSANSRALGGNMSRQAMLNNLSGKDVPDLTPLPTSNGLDTALQATALGGGFLSALGRLPSGGGSTGTVPGVTYPEGIPDEGINGAQLPGQGLDPAILDYWNKQARPEAAS